MIYSHAPAQAPSVAPYSLIPYRDRSLREILHDETGISPCNEPQYPFTYHMYATENPRVFEWFDAAVPIR